MAGNPSPSAGNGYLENHATLLLRSYRDLTGRDLISGAGSPEDAARALYEAPFFVASHDNGPDPVLTYGNLVAQDLFEMGWDDFTGTPSRFTAEEPVRAERAALLERVASHGYIEDYSGIRISASGRRFRIERATVWNLLDGSGEPVGQAASFADWIPL